MEYGSNKRNIHGIVRKVKGREWYLAVAVVNDNQYLTVDNLDMENLLINILLVMFIILLIYLLTHIKKNQSNLNKMLRRENEKDYLTNTYNRRYFNLYMENLWKRGDQSKSISLLMIDVDYFKDYNDTYGHLEGDNVLMKLTSCFDEHIRKDDVLSRYGGEEFVIILQDVNQEETVIKGEILKNAVYDLELTHETSKYKRITVSIGIFNFSLDTGISIHDAIEQADTALYEAKNSGKNKVVALGL